MRGLRLDPKTEMSTLIRVLKNVVDDLESPAEDLQMDEVYSGLKQVTEELETEFIELHHTDEL